MLLRTTLATMGGFVSMFITNGILAAAVIGPLFEARYHEFVAEPVNYGLLAAGYLIIALALALLYPRLAPTAGWFPRSLVAGVLVGLAIFLGAHTVIAGYTVLDPLGFILSGLLDSLGPAVGMVTVGFVYARLGVGYEAARNTATPPPPTAPADRTR
jgi:hypothetical protein